MAWWRQQTHNDQIHGPMPRLRKGPALCWNGHACPWYLHGRCHFQHGAETNLQHDAQDRAGRCRTCSNLREEVRQLRKEITELREAIQCLQSKEHENTGGSNKQKSTKKRKTARKQTEPEENVEMEDGSKDPEAVLDTSDMDVAAMLNMTPKDLQTFRKMKAIDASEAKMKVLDATDRGIEYQEAFKMMKEELGAVAEAAQEEESCSRSSSSDWTRRTPNEDSEEEEDDVSDEASDKEHSGGDTIPPNAEEEPPPRPQWRIGYVTAQPCRCKGKGKGKKGKSYEKGKNTGCKGKGNNWKPAAKQLAELDLSSSYHSCGSTASNWNPNWNGGSH